MSKSVASIPEDTARYQKIPEVSIPSNLMDTVDTFLRVAKSDPNLPQSKTREILLEHALNRFLAKHSATSLSLQVPNGIIQFYKQHEKWIRVNDAVENFDEWLGLAIRSYVEATLDFLYKQDEREELLSEYGFKEEN